MGLGSFLGALAPIAGAGIGSMFGNPTLGAGIGGLVGGLVGQQETNAQNAEQAEINRQFQADMSNTSYQRAVKDMQAAGLNPMLAYSQGGASTPGGATAQMGNAVASGMSTAAQTLGTLQGVAQLKQTETTTRGLEIDAQRKEWELAADIANEEEAEKNTSAIGARARHAMADLRNKKAQTGNVNANTALTNLEAKLRAYAEPEAIAHNKFWKSGGEYTPWVRALIEAAKGIKLLGK